MKKKLINAIVLIIGVCVIAFTIHKIKNPSSSSSTSSIDSGPLPVFNLKVYYGDDTPVIDRNITFFHRQKLFEIMDNEFGDEIVYGHEAAGLTLMSIGEYESDWINSYFALYVDGQYSTVSGEHLEVVDGMQIEWVWKSI